MIVAVCRVVASCAGGVSWRRLVGRGAEEKDGASVFFPEHARQSHTHPVSPNTQTHPLLAHTPPNIPPLATPLPSTTRVVVVVALEFADSTQREAEEARAVAEAEAEAAIMARADADAAAGEERVPSGPWSKMPWQK